MKQLTSLLMIFLSLTVFTAPLSAADKDRGPAITFTDMTHDFGTINEKDGPVSYEFEFVNDGDAPLVILSASASCGCTRPEFPLSPVQPGKKSKIKVTYNPAGRPGEFIKDVKIKCNDRKNRNVTLKISGTVIPK